MTSVPPVSSYQWTLFKSFQINQCTASSDDTIPGRCSRHPDAASDQRVVFMILPLCDLLFFHVSSAIVRPLIRVTSSPVSFVSLRSNGPSCRFRGCSSSPAGAGSGTMRVLNVAEKNDAAKNIANILSKGSSQRQNGLSIYNKVFQFRCDVPQIGSGVDMTMTSVSGHMLNYDFPATHLSWTSCDPAALFHAPVVKKVTAPEVKQNLLHYCRNSDCLIIWTDCDREGENIGYEVIDVVRTVRPQIKVFRAKFSEITGRSIFHAVSHLVEPDHSSSLAVDVRQELDLRIGAAFTRFQTMYLQNQNLRPAVNPETGKSPVVSYGSCQFPTLGFVVQRYKEREDFVSQPFWFLDLKHTKDGILVEFKWERNRLSDIHQCLELFMQVMSAPVIAKVISIDSKPKSKWRPLPLNTVAFEKLSASKLRMSAKDAMKIAEKLYTAGVISYPRTETNIFPKSLNLSHHVQQQTESQEWGAFASDLLQKGVRPRQGKQTDNAHPPIYPTKFTSSLNGQEARVYELIARHFLACCSADAEGKETTVLLEVNSEKFKACGLIIFARNYLNVYPYDKWSAKELPEFIMGETFCPDEILMREGATTAPQLLTESDLITLMERHGIGTDATHAEHIETIKARQYVTMTSDRRLKPLRLGLGLIEGYNKIKDEMSKPHLRAGLERDLQAICDGTKTPSEVLQTQVEMYRSVFQLVSEKVNILGDEIRRTNLTYNDNNDDGGDGPGGGGGPGGRGGGGNDGNDGGGGPAPRPPRRPLGSDSTTFSSEPVPRNNSAGRRDNQNGGSTVSSGGTPQCNCGVIAKKNVAKAGRNAGREFYGCPNFKGTGTGCSFFQWADDVQSAASGSGRGRGATSSSSRSTGTRKCGNCGQTGHIRSKCRNAGISGRGGRGRGGSRLLPASDSSFDQAYSDF